MTRGLVVLFLALPWADVALADPPGVPGPDALAAGIVAAVEAGVAEQEPSLDVARRAEARCRTLAARGERDAAARACRLGHAALLLARKRAELALARARAARAP